MSVIRWVHPSVSSTITDNSITFITSQGTTKLFVVFVSERGIDNKIQLVTTASEFEFFYGKPNIQHYGQAGYNIVNWLNSGGGVYALRVLPDDAGFSNAILNVQTRSGEKEVKDFNENVILVPDVTLRPIITYTSVNNTSQNTLEFDELRRNRDRTIDGYQNNMLFAVTPRGRGSGYNNLGFRMTLTDHLDNTFEFRIYNFEITQVTPTGGIETIEGPYEVSFDPDALSKSGESMFLPNVIHTYSSFFDIIFNEGNYESLGATINPYVNPNRIDFLSGQTRMVDEQPETAFNELTGKEEDIHFYIQNYGTDHEPTGALNIIDSLDQVEISIVNLDNDFRTRIYRRAERSIDRMKRALSLVRRISMPSNPFENWVLPLIGPTGTLAAQEDTVHTLFDAMNDARTQLYTDLANQAYRNQLSNSNTAVRNGISTLIDLLHEGLDYARVAGETDDTIMALVDLQNIEKSLTILQNYNLRFAHLLQGVTTMEISANSAALANVTSDMIAMVEQVVQTVRSTMNILNMVERPAKIQADDVLEEVMTRLTPIVDSLDELRDRNTTPQEVRIILTGGVLLDDNGDPQVPGEVPRVGVFNQCQDILRALRRGIELTNVEVNLCQLLDIEPDLFNTAGRVRTLLNQTITASPTLVVNDIRDSITLLSSRLVQVRQNTFRNFLQNFDSTVQLLFGTDGSIEIGESQRSARIDTLLARGYTGMIDPELLDTKMFPIDMVLDANYSVPVKNALVRLCTDIRGDFMGILDTGFQATPQQALTFRRTRLRVSNFRVAIFTQDFVVKDVEYTGSNIRVTSSFFLARKIPVNDNSFGISWNFVGPRRGTIDGFESMSFNPNAQWRENLYRAQVNYVESDPYRIRFNSQLTSQNVVSALSNINNVRALLRIQRDVERLMEDYKFEYNDSMTHGQAQMNLNGYLSQWIANRACTSISGQVYASEYDRRQRLMRVRIDLVFNSIIERIHINLVVNG